MDFDFGNLIYIILMIVFVIFGAMNKKKKVVQSPSEVLDDDSDLVMEKPVSSINENLKKLFGDYIDIDKPVQAEEDYYEEEIIQEGKPAFESILDTEYSNLGKVEEEEGVSSVYRLSDHMDSIRKDNAKSIAAKPAPGPSFTQQLFKEFDPKKALLYSEIFKPKYF